MSYMDGCSPSVPVARPDKATRHIGMQIFGGFSMFFEG
jgi:hypothetical protein